jgi:hypothetical protein
MRSNENINKWNMVDTNIDIKIPDFSLGETKGLIKPKINDYMVKQIKHNDEIGFGAVDRQNNTVAYLGIKIIDGEYAMAKNARCLIPNNGIMSALFSFVVRCLGYKLYSDFEMTQDGVNLWKSLINSKRFKSSIVDLKYNTQYDVNDVSSTMKDGVKIKKPEQDDKRFVYMIENTILEPETKFKLIEGDITTLNVRVPIFGEGQP